MLDRNGIVIPLALVVGLLAIAATPGNAGFLDGRDAGPVVSSPADRVWAVGSDSVNAPAAGSVPNWTNATQPTAHNPLPRVSAGMIYDSTDGYVVLFGGEHMNATTLGWVYLNDTWKFLAKSWTNISAAHAPSPRFGFLVADDPADHAIVLFGGNGPHASWLNGTWEFAGGVWTNVTHGAAPPGRFWGSMAYDSALGKVVLFGGNEGGAPTREYSNDTWTFHAGAWTNVTLTHSPSGRDDQALVDDAAASGDLMFGGYNDSGYLNDTWEYSGTAWTQQSAGRGPDVRAGPGFAYDAAAGKVVVYGGFPAPYYDYATWVYSGGSWSHYNTTPSPPSGTQWGQMCYDAADQVVVDFEGDGAYNGTWTLNFTSGAPPPLALTIQATPLTATVNESVTFTSLPSGGVPPYSYHWLFADGTGAATGNTSHAYAEVGTYDAMLYVNDSADRPISAEATVTVQHVSGGGGGSGGPPTFEYLTAGAGAAAIGILVALVAVRRRKKPVLDPAAPVAPVATEAPPPGPAAP